MSRWADEVDFVIVGTGAGGATAARVLSEAGFSLALVEEGAFLKPEDRPRELVDAMAMAVRGMATLATDSLVPMPLLQGKCVGGSTAINSGIIWRTPDDVREDWTRNWGLASLVGEALDDAFVHIEDELSVGPTEAPIAGGNNLLMERASKALGLPGQVIHRNARGCEGNGRCLQGCPIGARQSMEVSYVPRAIASGARLYAGCHVERVILERGRAIGVRGTQHDALGKKTIEIRARRGVIVAASAIFSPLLLARSGVRHANLGERFQAHPGAAIVGRFDEDVSMGFGASQGYEVPMRDRGFKLEALALPPDMLAARLPGAGRDWQTRVGELGRYAQWGGVVRMEALGRVRSGFFDGVSVRYEPTEGDLDKVRDALLHVGRMMFAVGANEIYPGLACMPEIVKSEEEYVRAMPARLRRADVHLVSSHLFGTACASSDARGVVDERFAVRGTEGLFVMDASVFPTNLGVNPQHSIMGLVWVASKALAARESERRAA
ncbi:MAG: GMC family oxidoreductase [Deltaproteobacteria bacterium]|nr:GMC family oxidoreductase [Deltaproteobacteria bacterium]